jgi:polar amino acid transport system substrate-binding protein
MKARPYLATLIALVCACGLAACASSHDEASDRTLNALRAPATTTPPPTTTSPSPPCDDAQKSYAPTDEPPGPDLARLRSQDRLRVGVDENTLQLSARNPETHDLEGFEVDLARAIGAAILDDPNPERVELVTVVTEQKVPYVEDRNVDMTVSAVSMTCDRWTHVDFSSPYLLTDQRVLVRNDSPVQHLGDLAHRKVCVTKGSTTFTNLRMSVPAAIEVELPARTDCLVALQDGTVDAIASHATILYGLNHQDQHHTKIVDDAFSNQSYAIALPKSNNHEIARFVNGVLEQLGSHHTIDGLYNKWIGNVMPPGTAMLPPPVAAYREEGT